MATSQKTLLGLLAMLLAHASLLGYSATLHSPTLNEPGHLIAGLTHWKFGRFEVYRVNPPLTHSVAAIPVVWAGYNPDWSGFYDSPGARPEFRMGEDFIKANGERSIWLFTLARWACIPFSLLGAVTCYFWSRELWGSSLAGLMSAGLWCFEPFLVGHAELVTPDVPATSLGMAATYLFWRWLKHPSLLRALAAGICLGMAELTKTSWIILFVLWPLLFLIWELARRFRSESTSATSPTAASQLVKVAQLGFILVLALNVINLVYRFDGSFTTLGEYQFVSQALTARDKPGEPGNRFSGSWLGEIPVPLPFQYVRGIDLQKKDFEDYGQPSYLRGEWKDGGWWHYYAYGLTVKSTHGLQLLVLLSLAVVIRDARNRNRSRTASSNGWRGRDLLVLLVPAVVVLGLVSSQQEFNHHVRYVLPVLGYAIVFAGGASLWWPIPAMHSDAKFWFKRFVPGRVVLLALLASVVVSLGTNFPHQMAYFNELSGGREAGYRHLLHSNIDWNQDLLFLKDWIKDHPEARPIAIYGASMYQPEDLGIECISRREASKEPPTLKWAAISVNELQKSGTLMPVRGVEVRKNEDVVKLLHRSRLVARVASSYFIYQVEEQTENSHPDRL